ncbi:MAG: SDH family Clp fold serine proteinase [Burkholderiales bacterium]
MPNWNRVLAELQQSSNNSRGPHDKVRAKYLKALHKHTKRNIIVYYSGWLQKAQQSNVDMGINDSDKTGFMTCSHEVNRSAGLDLILHTPGGDVSATESLIDYLHSLYNGDIRAIVPQLAMSGGTLMALSCSEIIMGRQSSLGPVDPQIGGMPAQGILEEFEQAKAEITQNSAAIPLWQPILQKYWPTLITSCQHAITLSDDLLKRFLEQCMFKNDPQPLRDQKIATVAQALGKQKTSLTHNRHISVDAAIKLGLNVQRLESDQTLQELVLTLHHALTLTFQHTPAFKITENHKEVAYVAALQNVQIR